MARDLRDVVITLCGLHARYETSWRRVRMPISSAPGSRFAIPSASVWTAAQERKRRLTCRRLIAQHLIPGLRIRSRTVGELAFLLKAW